LEILAQC